MIVQQSAACVLARIDYFEILSDSGDGTYLARDIVSGQDVVVSANAGPNSKPHKVFVADYMDLVNCKSVKEKTWDYYFLYGFYGSIWAMGGAMLQ